MGEGGTERRGLRRALQTAYRRGEDAVRARFAAFGEDAPPGPAASAALALAGIDEGRALSATLLARASTDAERFEDRYRLIKAAAELEAEARADAWLVSVATDAEEWMLRSEAIAALALRRSPRLAEAARRGLDDAYPRVRVAAADALGGDAASLRAVATLARRDPWPMVRASATSALGGSAEARPVVRAALGDRAQVVRAAAVRASIEAEDRGALDRVAQRLTDEDEWPEVIEAGIAYARELCLTALIDPLVAVLRRGMRPDAWAPDVDSAVLAVQALGLLGGQDARSALRSALSESAPGAIRAAAARAEREPGGCGAEN
jgi:HEAT repeat protein